MNYLEIAFTNRTMLILGALSTVALILLFIWLAKRYNNKKVK